MLIEVPEPEVILSVIISFVIGLAGLYSYYKIRPFIKTKDEMIDSSQLERLEYYERQLIDMKIRLDAMEMQGFEQKTEDPNLELKQFLEKLTKNQQIIEKPIEPLIKTDVMSEEKSISVHRIPNLDHNSATNYVLYLITDKVMTSRDIQTTLKRSREHTSRLMKKLFEDGYVQRNNTKPYTYSITKKGKEKIGLIQSNSTIA